MARETATEVAVVTAEFPASDTRSLSDVALSGAGDKWRWLVEEEFLEVTWAGDKGFSRPPSSGRICDKAQGHDGAF